MLKEIQTSKTKIIVKKITSICFIILAFINCSKNDEDSIDQKLVKSISNGYKFEYSNGLLTSFNLFGESVQLEYNSQLEITKKIVGDFEYRYRYDNQGRIKKEIWISPTGATNYYKELSYTSDEVIISVYDGEETPEGEIRLAIDKKGRITAIDEFQGYFSMYFKYDDTGNITYVGSEPFDSGTTPEYFSTITYDDKINPYYIALRRYNKMMRYLHYRESTHLSNYSLTPNNIIQATNNDDDVYINKKYIYDDDNYPITIQWIDEEGAAFYSWDLEYH